MPEILLITGLLQGQTTATTDLTYMNSDYRCFYCFARSFEKLLLKENISNAAKKEFTDSMVSKYIECRNNFTTPLFVRELHDVLYNYTGNPDPYKSEKKEYNDLAISMVPELERIINNSEDKVITALKVAIAGNIIDFAINDTFDIGNTLQNALSKKPAIDHSAELIDAVSKSSSILYLGDNAGEIVFDKLFIKTLGHRGVTFVVRGGPVLNDVTAEDAEYTRINEVAEIISSGFNGSSTVLERSSHEMKQHFMNADLIISKGQGNLEGLLELNDKRIFFLLMVKCDVMADLLGVAKGSTVVYNKFAGSTK